MLLLTDEHVPDDVVEFFRHRGHEVVRAREIFPPATADEVLADWGHRNAAVLVTWDRDFRKIGRASPGERQRFYNLSRISFAGVPYTRGVGRLEQVIDLIEFEYRHVQQLTDRRMIVSIGVDQVRVLRW